ncbi:hypothetical protein VOLCADRAFT_93950 [Volvox carteri f. nagariensis]|uniref:Kazal-like domain-containing protein n=1 Tax=Volvox carteri f. nagariensis TaxID=3068 RepID=D8U3I1_VOLCA|nr:uncharacterized protein VOLCADRAFT_93950 [Volvox carteri f. nagariensis]EFJ45826.1 hypothetical protein VOLCADRAFT_93950 [Volvox carteri f. nagariensis]|eukprot:XP_002953227.1 hypothetical protein VOLCADRAFT_93950 [Volvox carteri f. nagariensis]
MALLQQTLILPAMSKSTTFHGREARGWRAGQTGSTDGSSAGCPVDLLNFMHLNERFVESLTPGLRVDPPTDQLPSQSGSNGSLGLIRDLWPPSYSRPIACAPLVCGLVRTALPAVQRISSSGCAAGSETLVGHQADGWNSANPSRLPPRQPPPPLEQAVIAVIRACSRVLAVQLAMHLAALHHQQPLELSRLPPLSQAGSLVRHLANCPLDGDMVRKCLASSSVSGAGVGWSSTVGEGLAAVAAAGRRPDGGSGDALQCGDVGGWVSEDTWSFSGPLQSRDVAAAAAAGEGPAPVVWRGSCSCRRLWEPVCDAATGRQYPNRCYADCQGAARLAVPCSDLMMPRQATAASASAAAAETAPTAAAAVSASAPVDVKVQHATTSAAPAGTRDGAAAATTTTSEGTASALRWWSIFAASVATLPEEASAATVKASEDEVMAAAAELRRLFLAVGAAAAEPSIPYPLPAPRREAYELVLGTMAQLLQPPVELLAAEAGDTLHEESDGVHMAVRGSAGAGPSANGVGTHVGVAAAPVGKTHPRLGIDGMASWDSCVWPPLSGAAHGTPVSIASPAALGVGGVGGGGGGGGIHPGCLSRLLYLMNLLTAVGLTGDG